MYYAPVRRSSARIATPVTARLACVKHAASVQSEPGSNSSVQWFELKRDPKLQTCPVLPGRLDAWLLAVAPIAGQPDASPHTNYLQIFKERPDGKSARASRLLCPALGAPYSALSAARTRPGRLFRPPEMRGARSIAP